MPNSFVYQLILINFLLNYQSIGRRLEESKSKLELMMKSSQEMLTKMKLDEKEKDEGWGSGTESSSSGSSFNGDGDQRSDQASAGFGPMFKDRDHFNSLHMV